MSLTPQNAGILVKKGYARMNNPESDARREASGSSAENKVGAVIIGRNEGARLVAGFASLKGVVGRMVYVDSGSTDDSTTVAAAAGAIVVPLDMSKPFTAARARNAGMRALCDPEPPPYVQFLDGDCALREGWITTGREFLDANPQAAVACGRRRERFPEASVYNRLCDLEWDTPLGPARACGGDALMRARAFEAVGGYREDLIAGEEPELCVRLRQAGWEIWRLDAEMTWHDAEITRFGQWWRRSRRAGHAFAEGAALHGAPPERHWTRETRRAVIWGLGIPLAAVVAGGFAPAGFLLLLAYPAQVARLALGGGGDRQSLEAALFTVLGKAPEMLGVLNFYVRRRFKRRIGLIEYK
jgi:GT2 family glycosyltransferase